MKIDPDVAPSRRARACSACPASRPTSACSTSAPKEGETVFVSGGCRRRRQRVGQIAKIKGCRVAAARAQPEKVALPDATSSASTRPSTTRRSTSARLAEACPDGIDIYFENVGGEHLEAALGSMNTFGRIALCGMISQYNEHELPPGPRDADAGAARQSAADQGLHHLATTSTGSRTSSPTWASGSRRAR